MPTSPGLLNLGEDKTTLHAAAKNQEMARDTAVSKLREAQIRDILLRDEEEQCVSKSMLEDEEIAETAVTRFYEILKESGGVPPHGGRDLPAFDRAALYHGFLYFRQMARLASPVKKDEQQKGEPKAYSRWTDHHVPENKKWTSEMISDPHLLENFGNKFSHVFPVQALSIPTLRQDKSVMMACAQGRSGKTTALIIGVLNRIVKLCKEDRPKKATPFGLIIFNTHALVEEFGEKIQDYIHEAFRRGDVAVLNATGQVGVGWNFPPNTRFILADIPREPDDYTACDVWYDLASRVGRVGSGGVCHSFIYPHGHLDKAIAPNIAQTLASNNQEVPEFLDEILDEMAILDEMTGVGNIQVGDVPDVPDGTNEGEIMEG